MRAGARHARAAMTHLRPATPDDDALLARGVVAAGEGMPLVVWQGLAGAGGDPWALGRERARRDHGGFSWRNAVVAEHDGTAAGVLIDYRLPTLPEPVARDTPAVFVPLCELENLVCASWYVNVLAVEPALRGHGIGTALLAEAERRARGNGADRLSIIVSDANEGALRLYERSGYRRIAERPIAAMPGWQPRGRAWLLLRKRVTA